MKLYVAESDSDYFVEIVSGAPSPPLTSELSRLEIFSAISRKLLTSPRVATSFEDFCRDESLGRIALIPTGTDVFQEAIAVTRSANSQDSPVPIRSLDAIHVASALVGGASHLVATDKRLRDVARLVGLKLLPEEKEH